MIFKYIFLPLHVSWHVMVQRTTETRNDATFLQKVFTLPSVRESVSNWSSQPRIKMSVLGFSIISKTIHLGFISVSKMWHPWDFDLILEDWDSLLPSRVLILNSLISCPESSGEASHSLSPSGWTLFSKNCETTRDFLLPFRSFWSLSPNSHATQNSANALWGNQLCLEDPITFQYVSPSCANLQNPAVFSFLQQTPSALIKSDH